MAMGLTKLKTEESNIRKFDIPEPEQKPSESTEYEDSLQAVS